MTFNTNTFKLTDKLIIFSTNRNKFGDTEAYAEPEGLNRV